MLIQEIGLQEVVVMFHKMKGLTGALLLALTLLLALPVPSAASIEEIVGSANEAIANTVYEMIKEKVEKELGEELQPFQAKLDQINKEQQQIQTKLDAVEARLQYYEALTEQIKKNIWLSALGLASIVVFLLLFRGTMKKLKSNPSDRLHHPPSDRI